MTETVQKEAPESRGWFRANFRWLFLLCISLSLITSYYHDYSFVLIPNSEAASIYHIAVINGTADAPMQYRFAPYFIAQWFLEVAVRLGAPNNSLTLMAVYFTIRFILTTTAYLLLIMLFGHWFNLQLSVAGLLFIAAVNPLAEIQFILQPSDPWNLLFFTLGYLALVNGRDWWLVPLLMFSVPFHEVSALLVPAFIFSRYGKIPAGSLILRTVIFTVAWVLPYAAVHLYYGHVTNYMDAKLAENNLASIFLYNMTHPEAWLVFFMLFNVTWFAVFAGWKKMPDSLRRLLLMAPIFMIVILIYGRLIEGRCFMPIVPLFTAAGLSWLDTHR